MSLLAQGILWLERVPVKSLFYGFTDQGAVGCQSLIYIGKPSDGGYAKISLGHEKIAELAQCVPAIISSTFTIMASSGRRSEFPPCASPTPLSTPIRPSP